MSIQRGQSHIIEIHQPDLHHTRPNEKIALTILAYPCREGEDIRSGKHDGSPAAHSPAPNDNHARSSNLFHTRLTKERVIPRELLPNQMFIIHDRTRIPIRSPLPYSVPPDSNIYSGRGGDVPLLFLPPSELPHSEEEGVEREFKTFLFGSFCFFWRE